MNTTKKARRAGRATPRGANENFASTPIVHPPARAVNPPDTVPIYAQGRVIGHVEGRIFYKRLRASVHFLRRPPAIAFDLATLYQARDAGAAQVHITDIETGRVYLARIEDILRDGKRFNRGFGEQIYYLLSRWRAPNSPEQLPLFGSDPPPENEGSARSGCQPFTGASQGAESISRGEVHS